MVQGNKYEKLMDLARRRGFFWPSFEIYGGVSGFYDLGPLGAMLKENIRRLWLDYFVVKHSDIAVAIETPMITPEAVFKASGHLESFTDPIVQCSRCGRVFRADQLIESTTGKKVEGLSPQELSEMIREKGIKCPVCGGELGEVKLFNLLFQTYIGPYRRDIGYLRPEAAQGMFTSFKRVYTVMRQSLPLGIAQIGRVARNEISPRQGMIRLREFTIMEMEFFYDPEDPGEPPFSRFSGKLRILTADQRVRDEDQPLEVSPQEAVEDGIVKNPWLAYWMLVSKEFVKELGVGEGDTFFEEKLPEERAHYATQTFDQLVKVSRWGWVEVSGHAYRGDYDLSRHMKFSGKDLTVYKRFDHEVIKVKEVVRYDKALIGRMFKEEAPKVMNLIMKLTPTALNELKSSGTETIELGGYSIPKEAVWVEKVSEKVAGKRFIPHVVEPSFGAERLVFVALDRAFTVDGERIYLRLPPRIAPIKVAVFPLLAKPGLIDKAKEVFNSLITSGIPSTYDDSGSIGRRYARADEVGVPYAVTIDYQTLEDDTVTLRFRDTKEQVRVKAKEVSEKVKELIASWRLEG